MNTKGASRVGPQVITVPRVCDCTIVVMLLPRLFPRWKLLWGCKRRAQWVAINMCCGSLSYACDMHHDMAIREARGQSLACGDCPAKDITMQWSQL